VDLKIRKPLRLKLKILGVPNFEVAYFILWLKLLTVLKILNKNISQFRYCKKCTVTNKIYPNIKSIFGLYSENFTSLY